jgi:hypothetical protein
MGSHVVRTAPLRTAHITAFANPASLGSNTVLAAVPGAAIRVLGLATVATVANSVGFLSNATPISATFPLGANGGFVLPFNEHGWFQTAIGEALNITMSVATATGVHISYILVQGDRG